MAEISKIQPIGSSTQYDLSALKIKVNSTSAPSSVTTYRLIHCNATDGYTEVGVTTTLGLWRDSTSNYLIVGNNTALGGITLQKGNGKYVDIVPGSLTANRTITLPDASGTVLLANGTGNATQFLRGDNTWSNTLAGSFFADTIVATNTTTNGAQFAMRFSDKDYNTYGLMWTSRLANKGGRIGFRHYTENTSGTYNGYQENFYLPTPTSGRTSNIAYNILTTKGNDEISDGFKIWTKSTGKSAYINGGSALEIREVNCVTTNQSSWNYAPKLGFHWGGRIQGVLGFSSSGEFYLETSDGTGGTAILHTGKTYGAVWNDYAEFRKENPEEKELQTPGRCVRELGNGALALTTKRLERGCEIISDTFGFAIGQDEENGYNTPIASSGRVLAYPYESIEEFAAHIGWPVCSGPNGTVSIMTEEEEEKYPSRIIGTVSEIPDYEEWGSGNIKVDSRVWIRIR